MHLNLAPKITVILCTAFGAKNNCLKALVGKAKTFQIVKAVDYLHENQICHRDLKLENILLAKKGRTSLLKITDFGLSKQQKAQMKSYVGTKMYMAPEVIRARNHPMLHSSCYTYKADMWSLGCILFTMLCGKMPFASQDLGSLEYSKISN